MFSQIKIDQQRVISFEFIETGYIETILGSGRIG